MAKPSPLEQFLFKAIESHGLFQPKKAEDGLQLTPSVGSSTSSYTPPGIAPQSMNYTPVVSDEAYNDSKHAFEKRAGRDAFFSRLGNTAKDAGLALPFLVDHFLPGQPIKQPQVKPLETYNPNPYGTGSQALYEDGGMIGEGPKYPMRGGKGEQVKNYKRKPIGKSTDSKQYQTEDGVIHQEIGLRPPGKKPQPQFAQSPAESTDQNIIHPELLKFSTPWFDYKDKTNTEALKRTATSNGSLDSNTYFTRRQLLLENGRPDIEYTGKGENSLHDRSHYNPLSNTITLNRAWDLIQETAHARQQNIKKDNLPLWGVKDWLRTPYLTAQQQLSIYNDPRSLEFDAHKVQNHKLAKRYIEIKDSLYKAHGPLDIQAYGKPTNINNLQPTGTVQERKNGGKAAEGIELPGGPGDGPYSFVDEFKKLSKNKLDGASSFQIAKKAADSTGINPSLLYSSSYVEGMNKNLTDSHPLISDAYENAQKGYYTDFTGKKKLGKQSTTIDPNQYPVDGFATYGLDTFGSRFDEFVKKGYLPETFKDQFVPYTASNEKETVQTAAFKNNEAALMAKAAYLRSTQDDVDSYFKEKKQELDPEARDFFTMAFYNSTRKSARGMADEYMSAKDKKAFIEKGDTKYKSIWSNIHQRMELMPLVSESMSQMKYGGKMKKCENGHTLIEGQSYDLDPATIKELLNAGYQLDFE
jgi:Tfp pilus assembly protein PilP